MDAIERVHALKSARSGGGVVGDWTWGQVWEQGANVAAVIAFVVSVAVPTFNWYRNRLRLRLDAVELNRGMARFYVHHDAGPPFRVEEAYISVAVSPRTEKYIFYYLDPRDGKQSPYRPELGPGETLLCIRANPMMLAYTAAEGAMSAWFVLTSQGRVVKKWDVSRLLEEKVGPPSESPGGALQGPRR